MNYWLNKGRIENNKLEKVVAMIQEGSLVPIDKLFIDYIDCMIENIIRYTKFAFECDAINDKVLAMQDCRAICCEKVFSFDPTKGKAFNYFTTIILGHLRQCRFEKQNGNWWF